MKQSLAILFVVLISNVTSSAVSAQDSAPAADHIAALAPFLDEETILVAHVDLDSFDFGETARWIWRAVYPSPEFHKRHDADFAKNIPRMEAYLKQLREAGARHVYGVVSLADLGDGEPLFLVVPVREGGDAERLAALLARGPFEEESKRWRRSHASGC